MKKNIYGSALLLVAMLCMQLSAIAVNPGEGNGGKEPKGKSRTMKAAGAPLGIVWEEMGPNNFGTMTRAITYTSNGVLYAGSDGGGLWTSTNDGTTWTQVTGVASNLAVSAIAVDGNDIYVGTGNLVFDDRGTLDSANTSVLIDDYFLVDHFRNGHMLASTKPGEGVFVSTDGGSTWTHNNGTWGPSSTPFTGPFVSIQRIVAENGTVFVASTEGLYYSSDNLQTVTKSTGPADFTDNPVMDVEFGSGSTVWATTQNELYKSTDAGVSFTAVDQNDLGNFGDPPYIKVGGARISVAVAPSDRNTVYVTGANSTNFRCNGVWKTTDNGGTWTKPGPNETANSTTFAPLSTDGLYAMTLEVDPFDAGRWFIGGDRFYSYDDQNGLILASSTTYIPGFVDNYVPTPIHAIAFHPTTQGKWLIGTEEEIVRTVDAGENYIFATKGYNCGHLLNVSAAPNYKVVGGEAIRGVVYKSDGNSSPTQHQFKNLDNQVGITRFSLTNFDYLIGQDNLEGLQRSVNNGDSWESFYGPPDSTHPYLGTDSLFINRANASQGEGAVYDAGNAPVVQWCFDEVIDPNDLSADSLILATERRIIVATRSFIWVVTSPFGSVDSIPIWTRVSNSLISKSNDPDEYITAVAVSGDTNHAVFAGTNYGKLYRIWRTHEPHNIDSSYVTYIDTLAANTGMPDRWITDIAIDPNDPNNVVVTYGSYDDTDNSLIWISNNAMGAGQSITFREIGSTMSTIHPVYTAAFHPNSKIGALLVGTEVGVYSTTDDWTTVQSMTWNFENMGMDSVPVTDIYIRPYFKVDKGSYYAYGPEHSVFVSTFGRGTYRSSSLVYRDEEPPVDQWDFNTVLYPNPTKTRSTLEHELTKPSHVRVEVYSIDGRMVNVLTDRDYGTGYARIEFKTDRLEPGIYFLKSTIENSDGKFTNTQKSVVIR